jgi:hypothetical protein
MLRLVRLTASIALAAALSGCGEAEVKNPEYHNAELLLSKAAPRCTDAFATRSFIPSALSVPLKGPSIALLQPDNSQLPEKDRGSNPLWPWRPDYTASVLASLRYGQPKTADAVQTLVCVRETSIQVGVYQPSGRSAIRNDWDVRVLRWPSGEVMVGRTFRGPDPPKQATSTYEMTSGRPTNEAKLWLDDLIR